MTTPAENALLTQLRALTGRVDELVRGMNQGKLTPEIRVKNVDLGDVSVGGPYTISDQLPEPPTNTSWVTPGVWIDCSRAQRATLYINAHTINAAAFIQLVGSPTAPGTGSIITQFDVDDLITVDVNDSLAIPLPLGEAWHPYYGIRIAVPSGASGTLKLSAYVQEVV